MDSTSGQTEDFRLPRETSAFSQVNLAHANRRERSSDAVGTSARGRSECSRATPETRVPLGSAGMQAAVPEMSRYVNSDRLSVRRWTDDPIHARRHGDEGDST